MEAEEVGAPPVHGGSGRVREGAARLRRQVPQLKRPVRILGLDPGTRVVGFGVVDAAGTRLRFVEAGVLEGGRDAPLERRLAVIAEGLAALVDRLAPDEVAVEDVFVKADPKAALAIGHGRGALLAVVGARDLPVRAYAPASVKRSVAGNGRAGKDQVARMVGACLGLAEVPQPADATDALAVAIAHAAARRTQVLGGS